MGSRLMDNVIYKFFRYNIIPPLFICCFTLIVQVLVIIGNPNLNLDISFVHKFHNGLYSVFAWKIVLSFYFWAWLSLVTPGQTFNGPATPKAGYIPVYKANGVNYYIISLVVYSVIVYVNPDICVDIYKDFSSIISVLSFTSLIFCTYLLISGLLQDDKDSDDAYSLFYLYYRGVKLHPRILGVDVKQWSNCRVGMLGWALLVVTFCIASIITHNSYEIALGSIINALLINIYLLKFFYWETGYFNTLDITLDRAGYYLCWGCLCFVQAFYTFSAYYMVGHPSLLSTSHNIMIFIFGCVSIALNYYVDYQKEVFITSNGKCMMWGKPAQFLNVEYTAYNGMKKRSRLLTSGFWGIARHLNYVFEILLALSWSLPSIHYGVVPFAYVIFLCGLLIHRTFRDEEKCSQKYNKHWDQYCQIVPYRMIPGIF